MTARDMPGIGDLGEPALVCRWRLAGGRLPMANRHLRALRSREVKGRVVPQPLVAWAKEHIEWTLAHGSLAHPDGVLMLVVDEDFKATMAVGPYRALEPATMRDIVLRARSARQEATATRVAPETVWLVRDGGLEWLDQPANVASGTASLVADLARTLGIGVVRSGRPLSYAKRDDGYDGAFLASDEHGVVVPSDRRSVLAQRLADGYAKLLRETMRRSIARDAPSSTGVSATLGE